MVIYTISVNASCSYHILKGMISRPIFIMKCLVKLVKTIIFREWPLHVFAVAGSGKGGGIQFECKQSFNAQLQKGDKV